MLGVKLTHSYAIPRTCQKAAFTASNGDKCFYIPTLNAKSLCVEGALLGGAPTVLIIPALATSSEITGQTLNPEAENAGPPQETRSEIKGSHALDLALEREFLNLLSLRPAGPLDGCRVYMRFYLDLGFRVQGFGHKRSTQCGHM